MKCLDLLIVTTLCAAPCIVAGYASSTTAKHGNNPAVTDRDNEIAFGLATLFGMEAAEIVYPGISLLIGGCEGPNWQLECEQDMWVPQGMWDQCISCYMVCYHNCNDCDWWMFCEDSCQWNLYQCTDGELDLM